MLALLEPLDRNLTQRETWGERALLGLVLYDLCPAAGCDDVAMTEWISELLAPIIHWWWAEHIILLLPCC